MKIENSVVYKLDEKRWKMVGMGENENLAKSLISPDKFLRRYGEIW